MKKVEIYVEDLKKAKVEESVELEEEEPEEMEAEMVKKKSMEEDVYRNRRKSKRSTMS